MVVLGLTLAANQLGSITLVDCLVDVECQALHASVLRYDETASVLPGPEDFALVVSVGSRAEDACLKRQIVEIVSFYLSLTGSNFWTFGFLLAPACLAKSA